MHFLNFLMTGLAILTTDVNALPYKASKKDTYPSKSPYMPQAKSSKLLANVTDPNLSRDSCGSVKMGFRTLWTCRDTSIRIPNTDQYGFLFVNTAGWTDNYPDGSPAIQASGPIGAGSDGKNNILLMKGPQPTLPAFYPLSLGMCPGSGACDDKQTRWTGWPDSPPMVSETALDGTITAYTWMTNVHLVTASFEVLTQQPATTLYKLTYKPDLDENVLPKVVGVSYDFWNDGEIGFGVYGNVVKDGYAYLYGKLAAGGIALAKVPVDCIEDRNKYQYYVAGSWTDHMPSTNDTAAAISNASAGGQGTYYYSERAKSYVWIGQAGLSVSADFYITTAPNPEGPWTPPYLLYKGANGDGDLPSYSLQAHPHMLREHDDGIYLTWTQYFKPATYTAYVTPMVYVSFV